MSLIDFRDKAQQNLTVAEWCYENGHYEFWVTLIEPEHEDRQRELEELQAELGTDALVDYGVNFHFIPASVQKAAA